MGVSRKKLSTEKTRSPLALLYLALGPLRNAANSSDVPTEFAPDNKDEVLEGKFVT